jgi:hypothetical protein
MFCVEFASARSTFEVIVDKSDPFTKTDSQTIEFRVQVPAGGEELVTYKVHYTW